ncbi:hypothetical protein K443DRAFT_7849 [Laccaria amethystina LaAM-08-1]|uniref:F-box domain-containing protein n=1 Tax=Laccaria amethystina LaAM-08-1 TaxID=1095629 RepID=A0A0C9XEZ5_9AGAR|nr:hypothetical protein K443DRAFT_7849 [Laccaria amethystina LaAM-08-1]
MAYGRGKARQARKSAVAPNPASADSFDPTLTQQSLPYDDVEHLPGVSSICDVPLRFAHCLYINGQMYVGGVHHSTANSGIANVEWNGDNGISLASGYACPRPSTVSVNSSDVAKGKEGCWEMFSARKNIGNPKKIFDGLLRYREWKFYAEMKNEYEPIRWHDIEEVARQRLTSSQERREGPDDGPSRACRAEKISEHLHPIDLYHISRTNRSFQDILRSPSSSSIWRVAYDREDGVPRCPPDISELVVVREADLSVMRKRGRASQPHLPPSLVQEVCASLAKKPRLSKLVNLESDSSKVRFNICPDGFFDDDWPLYLKDEANRIDLQLSLIVNFADIKKSLRNITRREIWTLIRYVWYHALKTYRWAQRMAQTYKTQREMLPPDHPFSSSLPLSTDYCSLGPPKTPTRALHPPRPRHPTRKSTQAAHQRPYIIHQRPIQPIQERRNAPFNVVVPPTSIRRLRDMMRTLTEKEGDELLSPENEDVKDAMRKLPGAVESWTREKMRQLTGLLPGSRRVGVDDARSSCDDLSGDAISIDSPPPFLEELDEPDLHLLNLATSVFTCLGSTISSIRVGRCLIGWNGAGPHLRCGALPTHWDNRPHFSRRGYEAPRALVELVGWDGGRATVVEMDGFDGRFLCGGCSASGGATAGEREGRRRRHGGSAALHGKESEPEAHSQPSWSLLMNEAKADVVHYLAPVVRKGAIDHCKAAHEIRCPIENLDYLYDITTAPTPRKPAVFHTWGFGAPFTRCVETPLVRRDWVQVRTILRSTMDSPELQRAEGSL